MLTSVRGLLAASVLAGSMLAAAPAFADDADAPAGLTVSGNVALTTDYRFRGVSLSGGDPAIQGGITISHESGFYVGAWSSSLAYSEQYGNQELDLFGGYTKSFGGATVDAGLLVYTYPSNEKYYTGGGKVYGQYWEPYASISSTFGPATVKVGATYAWKQKSLLNLAGNKADNLYLYGNVDIAIPNTPVTVSGHLGYTDGVLAPCYYCTGDRTGIDYMIGASAKLFGPLSASVQYIGVSGPSIDGFTDDTVVGTLTASF